MSKSMGKILKESRKQKGLSVKEVSKILISKGFKASDKTIYSWENGNSEPTPDALLSLCKIYGIVDILTTFGYERNIHPDYVLGDDVYIEFAPAERDSLEKLQLLKTYINAFSKAQIDSLVQYAKFLSEQNND